MNLASKGFPNAYLKRVWVRPHALRKLRTYRVVFANDAWRTPTGTTAVAMAGSHHFTHPLPSFCLFGAASWMISCSALPASLSSSSSLPEDRISRKCHMYSSTLWPYKCTSFFQPDVSLWSQARALWWAPMIISPPPLSPSHPPILPPSRWPAHTALAPLRNFTSFIAAFAKLCGLPPPSLV